MEEVINFLTGKEKSTSEIASHLSKNYYDTLKILEELEKRQILVKIELGRFTYWKLKEVENEQKSA